MSYEKTILCLANSWKEGGHCIAGREFADGRVGAWVRPVGAGGGEVSGEEMRCEGGGVPEVLDILRVPMKEPRPVGYQQENHLIDSGTRWQKMGQGTWDDALAAVDDVGVGGVLWCNGERSAKGINDRIAEERVKGFNRSLHLVKPVGLKILVSVTGFGDTQRKVRAYFTLYGRRYNFAVTDEECAEHYLQGRDGAHEVDEALLCVSLGKLFEGYAYKLVAAVITPP